MHWMPNMQRITWNGIALQETLPGYAASHRLHTDALWRLAEKLFDKTWIRMRVIISPNDAEPVELSHPALRSCRTGGRCAARADQGRGARPRRPPRLPRWPTPRRKRPAAKSRGLSLTSSLRKLEGSKDLAPTPSLAGQAGQRARRRKNRRGQGAGRGRLSRRPTPGAATWRTQNSTPPRPTLNRNSTQPLPQRTPPKQPRRRRPKPPRPRARRSSRARPGVDPSISRATQFFAAQHIRRGRTGRDVFDATIEVPSHHPPKSRQADRHLHANVHGGGAQRGWPPLDLSRSRLDHEREHKDALRPHHCIPQRCLDQTAPTAGVPTSHRLHRFRSSR